MAFPYAVSIKSEVTRIVWADTQEDALELANDLFNDQETGDEIYRALCNNAEVDEDSITRMQKVDGKLRAV
jgi:hypothetical protein